MRNVIAHHCHVLADGTVIPDPGYEGPRTEQGPFHGSCSFSWLDERGTEPHMIVAEKSRREDDETAAASLPPWLPTISGYFEEEIFSGFRNIVWNIPGEPDPAFYNIVWGVGHVYRVVIDVNGVEVYDADHVAGDADSFTFTYAAWPAATPPYTATVQLFSDSVRTDLISSFSDT
jgi:hypothetical protein